MIVSMHTHWILLPQYNLDILRNKNWWKAPGFPLCEDRYNLLPPDIKFDVYRKVYYGRAIAAAAICMIVDGPYSATPGHQ